MDILGRYGHATADLEYLRRAAAEAREMLKQLPPDLREQWATVNQAWREHKRAADRAEQTVRMPQPQRG